MMNNYVGNISTIVKFIVCILGPSAAAYGVSESLLTAILTIILGFLIALIDSKYPNTFAFLGNASVSSVAQTEVELVHDQDVIDDEDESC